MKVLIHGLNGVGVEAAKNLLLAGPHTVTLHDEKVCEIQDLGANFYLTEADVEAGKPRAAACAAKLGELNGRVKVRTADRWEREGGKDVCEQSLRG
jgi:ubiquitin-activating enzyme E1